MDALLVTQMKQHFGERLTENVSLSKFTTARVGGPARCFVAAYSSSQLADTVQYLWDLDLPVQVLGSGANMLVSDAGLEAVVVYNKAKEIHIRPESDQTVMFAESGATLISVAREAGQHGYTGLEWASTIPGTLGGAVYGNAGAHKGDMSQSLVMAEILHREKGRLSLNAEEMAYSYRSSVLKRSPGSAVILSALLALEPGDPDEIQALMQANLEKRHLTQPTGSSMGSMFKNPAGDHAGRLIEAAGLKGKSIGGVQISNLHANFMVNNGTGTATDYIQLVRLVQNTVSEKFGVKLELEIELIGKWQDLQ